LNIFKNILPYEEIFTGSNYKSYTHKYYIGKSDVLHVKHPFQDSEVSDMKWVTYNEAIALIRPYNVERIQVINYIHNCLIQYSISNHD
jgi:hypothetical protein